MSLSDRRKWRDRVGIAIGKRIGRYNLAVPRLGYSLNISTKCYTYNLTNLLYKKYIDEI